MKFLNLTPHAVNIYRVEDTVTDGKVATVKPGASPVATFPPAGVIARAQQSEIVTGTVSTKGIDIDVLKMAYGETVDLPEPAPETGLIVSYLTAAAAKAHGRDTGDLYIVAHAVRDGEGRICGCTAFSQI